MFILTLLTVCYSAEYNYPIVNNVRDKMSITKQYGSSFISFEEGYSESVGLPVIPTKTIRHLLLPNEVIEAISVIYNALDTIQLQYPLFPLQEPISLGESRNAEQFAYDSMFYSTNYQYPTEQYEIRTDKMRGAEIATVNVFLTRYTAATNKLIVPGTIEVNITTKELAAGKNNKNLRLFAEDVDILKSIVDNKESVSHFYDFTIDKSSTNRSVQLPIGLPSYEYTVITCDSLKNAFLDLVHWKRQKGYDAGIVTIEDILSNNNLVGDTLSHLYDDAGKLREYLQNSYINGNLHYVLLGGDYTIIPIRYGWQKESVLDEFLHTPSDWYYTDFDSNWDTDEDGETGEISDNFDYAGEIYVGRLLCINTLDIKTWTRKQLLYETNPGIGDYFYLTRALFTEADGLGSDINNVINSQNYFNITLISEYPSDSLPISPLGSQIINTINENKYGLLSNYNHGYPCHYIVMEADTITNNNHSKNGIVALDVYDESSAAQQVVHEVGNGFDNLTNYDYPAIMYSISCHNVAFDDFLTDTSIRNLSEVFTCVSNGGGVAYLGNCRYGYSVSSSKLYRLFLSKLMNSKHIGITENMSKFNFVSSNNTMNHWLTMTHNIIGCPETPMWTQYPQQFTNVDIIESNGYVQVTPHVAGAKVCITSAADFGLSCRRVATVPTTSSSCSFFNIPESYVIVITKDNYIPYITDKSTLYIQNEVIIGTKNVSARSVKAGYDVTDKKAYGDVVVQSGGSLNIEASEEVVLKNNVTIQQGGTLNINPLNITE